MEQTGLAREAAAAAAKVTPIAGFVLGQASGWGPQEWSYVCMGAYAVLQAAHLVWKWRKEAKKA